MNSWTYLLLLLHFALTAKSTAPETKSELGTGRDHVNITLHCITGCIAHDCKELYKQGHTCSGVYTIKPDDLPAFEVMFDDSAWHINNNIFPGVL